MTAPDPIDADDDDEAFEAQLAADRAERESASTRMFGWSVLVIVALALALWICSSWMEASAFNRVTGSNVSTWDAMWIELRVQEKVR